MDGFDSIWSIVATVVPMIMGIVTLVVTATPTPKDDTYWGKIALVIGRVFSFTTYQGADGKINASLPVLGSAKPKSER